MDSVSTPCQKTEPFPLPLSEKNSTDQQVTRGDPGYRSQEEDRGAGSYTILKLARL